MVGNRIASRNSTSPKPYGDKDETTAMYVSQQTVAAIHTRKDPRLSRSL
jgi:hypothetical protein